MSSQAMGDAFSRSPYRGDRLLVHLAIADVVNDLNGNRLWATRSTLAEKARVSVPTVARALADMVRDGWLEVVTAGGGRGNPTEYLYQLGGKPSHGETDNSETGSLEPETVSGAAIRPLTIPREPNGEIRRVFDAWAQSTGRTGRTKLDEKRRKLIAKALRDYPLEEILAAVRGWERSAYHRGENEAGKVYNDLGLLLRDAEHIERFRDLAGGPPQRTIQDRQTRERDGQVERFYPGSGWVKEAG